MKFSSKKFFFVRHAESLWNAQNLCQGRADIDISPKGLNDARAFAKQVAKMPIYQIFTSPLKRALHTATIIKEYHPEAGFSILEELSERDWGSLTGMPSEEMYRIETLEEKELEPLLDPSIESRKALQERVTQGLHKAFEKHEEPLLVSHGRLFVTLCEVLGTPLIRQIPNLSLIEFTYISGQWHMRSIE
ncbi:MAG: histidine phosphatase family protein [Verrucomicrobia bacterium]|nr:histidine phosphatase family protein [Verrucomicrobiota bacterium]